MLTRPKNAEDALYELPESIKVLTTRKKTEDMLSNQMLSGIPEIDLGIEYVQLLFRCRTHTTMNVLFLSNIIVSIC